MTINTISDTLGYTLDTYSTFDPYALIDDGDWTEQTDFDHTAFVADFANCQAELLQKYHDRVLLEVTAMGSYSPREYNFKTDNSELIIKLNSRVLLKYITDNIGEFGDYLRETFTSYDGFMSFVANNWQEFVAELNENTEVHDRNWAIMLGWYLRRETLTLDDYFDNMYDMASEAAYNNASNLAEQE